VVVVPAVAVDRRRRSDTIGSRAPRPHRVVADDVDNRVRGGVVVVEDLGLRHVPVPRDVPDLL
jgi:hypothetical protein